jgi:8-amino-7-oxononanoate synthase
LIVDEAHAVGVYGPRGSGWIEETRIADDVFLSVNPAGKALGVGGAFVAGESKAIQYLVQRARQFIFSTAPPPATAAALSEALAIIEHQPERRRRLLSLAGFARQLLNGIGLRVDPAGSQIIPVILGDNASAQAIAGVLQQRGFDVRAIRPPTVPDGTARLRISINSGLDETRLREFAGALASALKEFPAE